MVKAEEILEKAYSAYPERLCWYGSMPAKHLDDNLHNRHIYIVGIMRGLTMVKEPFETLEETLHQKARDYMARVAPKTKMSLDELLETEHLEKWSKDWWEGNRILQMFDSLVAPF